MTSGSYQQSEGHKNESNAMKILIAAYTSQQVKIYNLSFRDHVCTVDKSHAWWASYQCKVDETCAHKEAIFAPSPQLGSPEKHKFTCTINEIQTQNIQLLSEIIVQWEIE